MRGAWIEIVVTLYKVSKALVAPREGSDGLKYALRPEGVKDGRSFHAR